MSASHTHNHHANIDETNGVQRLILALFVNLVLTVVQVIGGIISGSLALVADALHNFSDAAALLIALIARKWAEKPADENRTFGYKRAELIGAMINLTTLILIGIYLLFEAVMRVFEPEPIAGWIVVIIACVALVVDVITAVLTYAMSKDSFNIRAAFLHNVADALSSVAVIIAGTLIIFYEWYIVDTICTFLIAGYVLFHGYIEIKSVIRILMQSVPADIDINEVTKRLEEIENIKEVHHLHVWELNEHERSLEAHVVITESGHQDAEIIKGQIKDILYESFHISHSTIEFEYESQSENNNCCDNSIITPH
ncbi:MAG: cation transporter [Proteobacteria bacterium]|nr:cation transporter [Pseudomonadota bacterium]NOG60337.1 cation transporter [Pseudomonadota bacterium]